jgi:YbgC/YbaW family acyl-CoA thioester hydrolase
MFSIEVELDDEWVAPIYDHVHHGRCFYLLEQARVAYMAHIGFPNDVLLAQGQAAVITAVAAQYKREVKRGRVTVTCEDLEVDGKTLIIGQKILNERGKVAVAARIESVFMDMDTRRGMLPPEGFVEAFLATGAAKKAR